MPEEFRFSVEKLVYGGDGLGHAAGQTVFVPYVLPAEEVRAAALHKNKKVIRAGLLEVIEPAKDRVAPACAHFQTCGGCHYQHIPLQEQLRWKTEILRETLSRIGGIQWTGPIMQHASPPLGYRNRAQWAVRAGPPRAPGYFQHGNSAICEIHECPVLSPRLADVFGRLRQLLAGDALPGTIEEIEAFADSANERILLNIAFEKFAKPPAEIAATIQAFVPSLESLLMHSATTKKFELFGPGFLIQNVAGFSYQVSHLSFFQVNRFLAEELLREVTRDATGALALDLYAGVGFFSLPLARIFEKVVAVDANLAATRDLRTNAERAGLKIAVHEEDAETFLRKTRQRPDLVVLDPPRAGLGTDATALLARLRSPHITYLSCDPATLARDLAVLTGSRKSKRTQNGAAARYEIEEVHLFDLFPQTYHIETLVRLRRAPNGSGQAS